MIYNDICSELQEKFVTGLKFSMGQTHKLKCYYQKSLSCYTEKINQIKSGFGFNDVAVSYECKAFAVCLTFWSWLVSLAPE
jgi:hypothetical protein